MRTAIEFPSHDGTRVLRGETHVPDDAGGPVPAVVVSAGFGDVAARLRPVVKAFVAAGLGVLVYDHATFGSSEGEPRQEIDPVAQVRDLHLAVTAARRVDGFDPDRIGLWGISFSGAHVLSVAAWDPRIRAVVSVVPWIAGRVNLVRMGGEQAVAAFGAMIEDERATVLAGATPARMRFARRHDDDTPGLALFSDDVAHDYFTSGSAGWDDTFTLRSVGYAQEYDVRPLAELVSPTPLLMVVARDDNAMPTDQAIAFHDAALEPKELVVVEGGHYGVYPAGAAFGQAVAAAVRWFGKHL